MKLKRVLEVESPDGTPILTISAKDLAEIVEQNPWAQRIDLIDRSSDTGKVTLRHSVLPAYVRACAELDAETVTA